MGLRSALAALSAGLVLAASAQAAAPPRPGAVFVKAWYQARVAHVQPIGELYSGERDVDAGSGLLLGDRYVLTANHLIPEAFLYKTLTINVRLGSNQKPPRTAHLVERDADHDLALLQLDAPTSLPRPPCPIEGLIDQHLVPVGSSVFVLGYPVNEDFIISEGILGGRRADGRLFTQAPINAGDSGGPVFSERGYLVGVAQGSLRKFDRGGGAETVVEGMSLLIPASAIVGGPIGARLRLDPTCWMDHAPTQEELDEIAALDSFSTALAEPPDASTAPTPTPHPVGSTNTVVAQVEAMVDRSHLQQYSASANYAALTEADGSKQTVDLAKLFDAAKATLKPKPKPKPLTAAERALLPRNFDIAYPVAVTHPAHDDPARTTQRTFTKLLTAEEGYRITACTPTTWRENHADAVKCSIAPGGRTATFTVDVTNGPQADAWQGLWEGAVKLVQKR